MPRFSASRFSSAQWLAPVAAALVSLSLMACAAGTPATPAPAVATPAKPSFDLTITGGPAAGTFASAPAASLNICTRLDDGGWRALYAGGEPWLSMDLHLGPRINEAAHASDVALEITAGSGYLWIDQGGFRGGDAPGRSQVTARSEAAGDAVTFHVTATTPNRTSGGDGATSDVALTLACPV